MTDYKKPVVVGCDDVAEGVYAASGCYTVTTNIHQRPEFGRGDYRIQVNARHDTSHTCSQQLLTLGFNQSVEYSSSNGTLVLTSGPEIKIAFSYWNNPKDNIGMGDVIVTSEAGLSVTYAYMTDNA